MTIKIHSLRLLIAYSILDNLPFKKKKKKKFKKLLKLPFKIAQRVDGNDVRLFFLHRLRNNILFLVDGGKEKMRSLISFVGLSPKLDY